ncbi:70 kDa neurofilament protein-like isoform X4 [Mya arenaria]|uniref:70 kDa neurofilament protein-like isoform X4 n=1 Tax=Mya arenaria TaxID=6604 RepID=UPI0022DFA2EF|nr:70 kDa neurofilament protein-like isoform X4 [Mya arenaria]
MSQSTVTEKRTVISSSSTSGGGGYESLEDIPYKANLGSRSSNIMTRSSLPMRSSSGGGTSIVRTVEYGYGSSMGGMGPGGYTNVSNTGVSNVKNTREREKKDLQDLNERFANYIEKVRFLEAQNRKLGSELDELRSKWGKETSHIKQMYEAELAEARRLIDDLSKDKAALEIKMSSVQEQNAEINRQLDEAKKYRQQDREIMNKQNQQLADLESELNMLRRTIESLETERGRDKATINRLQQEVDKLRIDLNNETLAHLDAENRRQTLEEEMEFMKKVHEQELKELAALAYRDTTAENREYWKNELGQAIRDIQSEYDAKVEQLRGDMEGFYNLKIQEFRTGATKQNMEVTHVREENKKIVKQMSDLRGKYADLEARNAQLEKQYRDVMRELDSKDEAHMMEVTQFKEEISKLRVEMEGILQELQTLMDAKLSLELEICAYRKLLEGEENRVGLKKVVEQVVNTQSSGGEMLSEVVSGYESRGDDHPEHTKSEGADTQMSMKMMRGEVSAKTTYQRTSTGPIAISEVSPEGKFIMLENTSSGPNRKKDSKGRMMSETDVNLDGWKLRRTVDGKRDYSYNFRNFTLKAGKKVKILARGSAAEAGLNDLVFREEDNWGVGSQVTTALINDKNEDKASHVQKTLYN